MVSSNPALPLMGRASIAPAAVARTVVGSARTFSESWARMTATTAFGGKFAISAANACFASVACVRSCVMSSTMINSKSSLGRFTDRIFDETPPMDARKPETSDGSVPGASQTETLIWTAPESDGAGAHHATAERSAAEAMIVVRRISEIKPQSKLHHAPAGGTDDLTCVQVRRFLRADQPVGIVPVGVIDEVKRGQGQLEGPFGGECNPLIHRDVVILVAGIAKIRMGPRQVTDGEVR